MNHGLLEAPMVFDSFLLIVSGRAGSACSAKALGCQACSPLLGPPLGVSSQKACSEDSGGDEPDRTHLML